MLWNEARGVPIFCDHAGVHDVLFALGLLAAFIAARKTFESPTRSRILFLIVADGVALLGFTWSARWFTPLILLVQLVSVRRVNHVAYAIVAMAAGGLLTALWWYPVIRSCPYGVPSLAPQRPQYRFVASAHVDQIPDKIRDLSHGTLGGKGGRVDLVRIAPGQRFLNVHSDGWNLLVSTDAWFPGWRVYWNGDRLPPVVVNGAFAGSFIPPGDARVEFRYRPDVFDTGVRFAPIGMLLLVAIAIGGARVVDTPLSWLTGAARIAGRTRPRIIGTALLIAACAAYGAVLFRCRTEVAGGADSSGYLNEARLWRSGRLIVPLHEVVRWSMPPALYDAFIPLGFAPGPRPETMVPTYPPGLPLQIAGFSALIGPKGQFVVAPLSAMAAVVLMFFLAIDFGFSKPFAAAAAAILALCPAFVFFAIQIMSDVPATCWAIAAILCARRAGRGARWAVAAGVCQGIAVLVRPTNILLVPAAIVALGRKRQSIFQFIAGLTPAAVFQLVFSAALYGSPFKTGYGDVSALLALSNFPPRFHHYAYWLAVQLTPLVFPIGLAGWGIATRSLRDRLVLALWFIPIFGFYCFYGPYEAWWYTRFLLPALPPLILGMLMIVQHVLRRSRSNLNIALSGIAVAFVLCAEVAVTRERGVLDVSNGEQLYRKAIAMTTMRLPSDAAGVAMQFSGAWYYETGKLTLRWDDVSPDQFRAIRASAPPGTMWFSLVADFESNDARLHTGIDWQPAARIGDVTLSVPRSQ